MAGIHAPGSENLISPGTFDAETNLLYVGTGNPAPDFDGEVREGDNLYTDSVIAVDVDSGQIRWHYQCTPHDVWDYDSIGECILFESGGRKLLGHFDKNGYFFVLDRTNGERVSITPFVDRVRDLGAGLGVSTLLVLGGLVVTVARGHRLEVGSEVEA